MRNGHYAWLPCPLIVARVCTRSYLSPNENRVIVLVLVHSPMEIENHVAKAEMSRETISR